MAEPATPPSAIERKMDRDTTSELTPWRPKRISLREKEREREREQSPGARVLVDGHFLQIYTSAGTCMVVGRGEALVEFVL